MAFPEFGVEWIKYQKVIFHPLYKSGFIPDGNSEVFVRNLPSVICDQDLLNFFKKAGVILKIRIMMDESGLRNRGFCYVTYMNSSSAKRAINELNGEEFQKNTHLLIKSSINNCRIFMGGIPTHKTKDEVWQELYKHGVKNIVDVIMYRSYSKDAENRGFVFIEFQTHEQAAYFRAKYNNSLKLWGYKVIIDWSVPIPETDERILEEVTILYLRNLDVTLTPKELQDMIVQFINKTHIQKIFKFKNYAFVHVDTRDVAERLLQILKDYFKGSHVEVEWAKPNTKYTSPEYRQFKVRSLSRCRSRTDSSSSISSLLDEQCFISPKKCCSHSPKSVQERTNSSFARQRLTSTGSYEFVDSPGSSTSNELPLRFNCRASPSYGDVVQNSSKPLSPSPVPYFYHEFCSTPPSNSSTPNSFQYEQSPIGTTGRLFTAQSSMDPWDPIKEYQQGLRKIFSNERGTRISDQRDDFVAMMDCRICKDEAD